MPFEVLAFALFLHNGAAGGACFVQGVSWIADPGVDLAAEHHAKRVRGRDGDGELCLGLKETS
jgi:hypothetical protein